MSYKVNIIANLGKGIKKYLNENFYLVIYANTIIGIYHSIHYYDNGKQVVNDFCGNWMFLKSLPDYSVVNQVYIFDDYNYYAKSEKVQKYISLL